MSCLNGFLNHVNIVTAILSIKKYNLYWRVGKGNTWMFKTRNKCKINTSVGSKRRQSFLIITFQTFIRQSSFLEKEKLSHDNQYFFLKHHFKVKYYRCKNFYFSSWLQKCQTWFTKNVSSSIFCANWFHI